MRVRELKVTYGALESCGEKIDKRIQAAWFVRRRTQGDPRESFFVFHLNNNHSILSFETVSIGTINQTLVHPREVFRAAVAISASAIIIGHNHPSGKAVPSREDIQVTKNLVEAGEILGIPVVDHLVVTAGGLSLPETPSELPMRRCAGRPGYPASAEGAGRWVRGPDDSGRTENRCSSNIC